MKYGMNFFLWSGELGEDMVFVFEFFKLMGYDGVEIFLFNFDFDYVFWGK